VQLDFNNKSWLAHTQRLRLRRIKLKSKRCVWPWASDVSKRKRGGVTKLPGKRKNPTGLLPFLPAARSFLQAKSASQLMTSPWQIGLIFLLVKIAYKLWYPAVASSAVRKIRKATIQHKVNVRFRRFTYDFLGMILDSFYYYKCDSPIEHLCM
jgi:hypothetical protein